MSELITLKWDQVDLKVGLLHVKRLKNGLASTHPVRGIELRALKTLKREHPDAAYVFISERGTPLSGRTVRQIVAKAGEYVNLRFTVHPHMLRHSTGFYLANKGEGNSSHPILYGTRKHQEYGHLHGAFAKSGLIGFGMIKSWNFLRPGTFSGHMRRDL